MPSFSQRLGLEPLKKVIQKESLDAETRNGLWSPLYRYFSHHSHSYIDNYSLRDVFPFRKQLDELAESIWTEFFKHAFDTLPNFGSVVRITRDYFFEAKWNKALDLLDFVVQRMPPEMQVEYVGQLNYVLERENSAYRFVDGLLLEITTTHEIESIEAAASLSETAVSDHIKKSLRLLSDRKQPDYHNSVKESVSAIEAAAKIVTGENGTTLSDALKILGKGDKINPNLKNMLMSLYAYSSDEGGVRHANKEGARPVTKSEALLILIIASAACGYLIVKKN